MNYYKIILNLIVFFCLSNNVNAQSYSQALLDSANAGYASAQNKLGYMYINGEGVTKDYAEALKWFRKAAEQENAKAQYNLGVMYINGEGVTKDYAEAFKWFRKAAEQGNERAQNLFMIKNGQGKTFKTDDGSQEVSTIIKEGEFILGGWLPEHFKYKLYSLSENEVDCKIFYQENLFAEYRLNIPSSDIEQFTPIMSCSYMEKSSELFKAGKQILDNSIEHRIFDFILEWGSSFLEKAERLGMKKAVIPIADYLYSRDHSGDWIEAYHLYKKVSDTEKDGYSTYMAYLCFKDKGFDLVDDISTLPKERMRLLNLAISRGSKAAVQEKARVLKEEKQAKINSAKAQAENKKKAEYNRKHPTYMAECKYCWGNGKNLLNLNETCAFCNGRGWVIKRR